MLPKLALMLALAGANVFSLSKTKPVSFSPGSGTYSSSQAVSLTSATPGAAVYCCTGSGCNPYRGTSRYYGPGAQHTVTASETLRCSAYSATHQRSAITQAIYTVSGAGCTAIAGQGWNGSTSLTDYPKSGSVTTCFGAETGCIVDIDDGLGGETPYQRLLDAIALLSTKTRVLVRNNSSATVNWGSTAIVRTVNWGSTEHQLFAYGTQRVKANIAGFTPVYHGPLQLSGTNERWKGFEFTAGQYGIVNLVELNGTNNKVEDFWIHDNAGNNDFSPRAIGLYGTNDIVQDTILWRNGVPNTSVPGGADTNRPDGLQTGGSNCKIVRVAIYNGLDDCFDLWGASNTLILDSAAWGPGFFPDGSSSGDGTGFKLGGQNNGTTPTIIGSIAVHTKNHGISNNLVSGIRTVTHDTVTGSVLNSGFYDSGYTSGDVVNHVISHGNAAIDTKNAAYTNMIYNDGVDPLFVDTANGDYSLGSGSPAIGSGASGANLGASTIALQLLKDTWNLASGGAVPTCTPGSGGCSNMFTKTEALNSNPPWSPFQLTVTTNAAIGPGGDQVAEKLAETVDNGQHRLEYALTWIGGTGTLSASIKAVERNTAWLRIGTTCGYYFSATDGSALSGQGTATASPCVSEGNSWWRCSVTCTGIAANPTIYLNVTNALVDSYVGTAGSGIYMTNLQFDSAASASTYCAVP